VVCHFADGGVPQLDLTVGKSYATLLDFGRPSLRQHVQSRYNEGRSVAGAGAAGSNPLLPVLQKGHYQVQLSADDWDRLVTWMDSYGQRLGSFDKAQEQRLAELRQRMAAMLAE
jgi:hypothetical protein